jgi:hypothetical protein
MGGGAVITGMPDRHVSGMPCRHPSGVLGPCGEVCPPFPDKIGVTLADVLACTGCRVAAGSRALDYQNHTDINQYFEVDRNNDPDLPSSFGFYEASFTSNPLATYDFDRYFLNTLDDLCDPSLFDDSGTARTYRVDIILTCEEGKLAVQRAIIDGNDSGVQANEPAFIFNINWGFPIVGPYSPPIELGEEIDNEITACPDTNFSEAPYHSGTIKVEAV